MRLATLSLILAMPAAALAQTPRDIAAQVWPHGTSGRTGSTSTSVAVSAGAFTARDLTRQIWPLGAPAPDMRAPADGGVALSGMSGADLAHAFGEPARPNDGQPIRIVSAANAGR